MSNFADLATQWQATLKALQMYTANHPRSQEALQKLTQQMALWHGEKPSLQIVASNNKLFVDGEPVGVLSVHMIAMVRQISERHISGFIFRRGIPAEELLAVLELLILKPAKIEEMGGAVKILGKQNLRFAELSQTLYREVKAGAVGESDGEAMVVYSRASAPAQETDKAPDALAALGLTTMIQQWMEILQKMPQTALPSPPAVGAAPRDVLSSDLAFLGPMAKDMGWGDTAPSNPQVESLRQGIMAMPSAMQFSILEGMDSLPGVPASLRPAFQALAPEILWHATANLLTQGKDASSIKERVSSLLAASGQKDELLGRLNSFLLSRGEENPQVQEVLHQVEWEHSSTETRIQRALEGTSLWDLSLDQRLSFMRNLLDSGRSAALLRILERLLEELSSEESSIRETAAHTLAGVVQWMNDPGLPEESEGALIQALAAHFGWEPNHQIHRPTAESLNAIITCLVNRGELDQVMSLIQELEGLCAFLEGDQEWRQAALTGLRDKLASNDLLQKVVINLHAASPDAILKTFVPYFEFVGEPAGRFLVEILGEEPDRKKRGRLLDMIRVLGDLSFQALLAGLRSPTWYLVRNTLNLMADMGDAGVLPEVIPSLRHSDPRVQRAAVRAVWKLGGPEGTPHLLNILTETDSETQMEILFGLGQSRAKAAAAPIAVLAQDHQIPEKVRVKCVDTLGLIGLPESIPVLAELVRRKGRIFTSLEPIELRLASARALASISTPEAIAALQKLADLEPKGHDKEALLRILALQAHSEERNS